MESSGMMRRHILVQGAHDAQQMENTLQNFNGPQFV